MKITPKLLTEKEACEDQVETFKKLFPDGAEITEANLRIQARHGQEFGRLRGRVVAVLDNRLCVVHSVIAPS